MYFPVDPLRAIRQYLKECIETKPNFWRYLLKGELHQKIEQVQSSGLEEITGSGDNELYKAATRILIYPDAGEIPRLIGKTK